MMGWLKTAFAGLFGGVLLTSSALAGSNGVVDNAGFFSKQTVASADEKIASIKKQFGQDVLIETFATVPADMKANYERLDKAGRERFVESWFTERARANRVNGVYVLICKNPSMLRIRAGRDAGHVLPTRFIQQTGGQLVSDFRVKNFDGGLTAAVDAIGKQLAEAKTRPAGAPVQAPLRGVGGNGNWVGWVVLAVAIVGGLMLVSTLFRGMTNAGAGAGYGGGGGLLGSLLAGFGGAMLGNWAYNSFFGSNSHAAPPSGGGDFSGGDQWGGDAGGGWGGGDFGGDVGGGDFGGGDFGGGDF